MAGRRLGRGLQFLLSDRSEQERASQDGGDATRVADQSEGKSSTDPGTNGETAAARQPSSSSVEVDINALTANPHQPRKHFDPTELEELASSIRVSGILQPILVRRSGEQYEIVAGERRFRAAKLAGLAHVPVLVREVDDVELRLFALVENLQRSDLDPIEKARSFRDIKSTTGWTHNRIAEAVGMDRSHVTNFLRLLELETPIQTALREGRLTMGHARALLSIPVDHRTALAERVQADGLSVREVENLARSMLAPPAAPDATHPQTAGEVDADKPRPRSQPAWAREMEQHLIEALGCRVAVQARGKSGRIILDVGNRSEFDRVYELLLNTLPDNNVG